MLIKGSLDTNRPPIICINNKNMSMVKQFIYLGVTFAGRIKKIKIDDHITEITNKCRCLFGQLKRVAKREYGLKFKALKIIYKGFFVAIATYATAAWYTLTNERHWRSLASAQRSALITVTRAYRTTSTEALPVITGVVPIKME